MALSSLGLGRYRQGKRANVNLGAPSRGGFPLYRGPRLGWRRRALASTWWSFNLSEKLQEGTGGSTQPGQVRVAATGPSLPAPEPLHGKLKTLSFMPKYFSLYLLKTGTLSSLPVINPGDLTWIRHDDPEHHAPNVHNTLQSLFSAVQGPGSSVPSTP